MLFLAVGRDGNWGIGEGENKNNKNKVTDKYV